MVRSADVAVQRQLQAPEAAAAASKVVTALWVLGLVTASVAITLLLAVPEPEPLPPLPGLRKNAYLLALSVAFFAGVAGVMAAICTGWQTIPGADRRATATGRKLVYSASVLAVGELMVVVSLLR